MIHIKSARLTRLHAMRAVKYEIKNRLLRRSIRGRIAVSHIPNRAIKSAALVMEKEKMVYHMIISTPLP